MESKKKKQKQDITQPITETTKKKVCNSFIKMKKLKKVIILTKEIKMCQIKHANFMQTLY